MSDTNSKTNEEGSQGNLSGQQWPGRPNCQDQPDAAKVSGDGRQ
jgi:hypothetical protein